MELLPSPELLAGGELLALAMCLVVNAGLRDTDAWQAARGRVLKLYAESCELSTLDVRRALVAAERAVHVSEAVGEFSVAVLAELRGGQ